MAPDPTFEFVEGPCCLTFDFVFALWILITVSHIVTCNLVVLYMFVITHGNLNLKENPETKLDSSFLDHPVRIQVRIDPPHPLVCSKRRLNGAVLRMRREKPRSRVTAGVA
jgi:hypothetical protein